MLAPGLPISDAIIPTHLDKAASEALASEIARLADYARPPESRISCSNVDCPNRDRPVSEFRDQYWLNGYYKTPANPIYQCSLCKRRMRVAGQVARIHPKNHDKAVELFPLVISRAGLRSIVVQAGLSDMNTYYTILNFIHRRCRDRNGAAMRSLLCGETRLPDRVAIAMATHPVTLSTTIRSRRQHIPMAVVSSADAGSGFMFALTANHDPRFDCFSVNRKAAASDDLGRKPEFRKCPQFVLSTDEHGRRLPAEWIVRKMAAAFLAAENRAAVETVEVAPGHGPLRDTMVNEGVLVNPASQFLACMALMRDMLRATGVNAPVLFLDDRRESAEAFEAIFGSGDGGFAADALQVRFDRQCSAENRVGFFKERARVLKEFAKDHDAKATGMPAALMLATMRIAEFGNGWFPHPRPSMDEPGCEVRWLTEVPVDIEDRRDAGESVLAASLSAAARLCDGSKTTKPETLQIYLDIHRAVHNFVQAGKDGRTPAMRLGLADRPLGYADILWPPAPPAPERTRDVRKTGFASGNGETSKAGKRHMKIRTPKSGGRPKVTKPTAKAGESSKPMKRRPNILLTARREAEKRRRAAA